MKLIIVCKESLCSLLSHKHNITVTVANGFWGDIVLLCRCWVIMSVSPSVGPSGGQTEGDVQTDVGAAAAGREMSPPHRHGPGQRETQTHRLHEQERRLHRPAGAGEGEVRANREYICVFISLIFRIRIFCLFNLYRHGVSFSSKTWYHRLELFDYSNNTNFL